MMPAALLKVRHAPRWQIFVGGNYARYVKDCNSKGRGHVDIVLIAPVTHRDQEERVNNRVNPTRNAAHEDPWFFASTEEALSLFSAVYPPDVTACAAYKDDSLAPPAAKPQEPAAVQRKLTKLRDSYHFAEEAQDPSRWRILREIDQLCTQAVQLPIDDPATMHALTQAYEVSTEFGSPMACIVRDRGEQAIQRTLAYSG
jgi:hypothetical protein